MRRSDREITERCEIIEIIRKCDVCRLAFAEGNKPYVVPMNFGFELIDDTLVLYFHGAAEGKKHDIMAANPLACFEMDCAHRLVEAEEAWHYTMEYESVIGSGEIRYITEKPEKARALARLMKQYAPGKDVAFPDHVMDSVTVFKLVVRKLTGKRLRKEANK